MIDNAKFHDLVLQQPHVQRARPLGGLEQAKAISLASFSPSKIRCTDACASNW